jgi:hypothetical protein
MNLIFLLFRVNNEQLVAMLVFYLLQRFLQFHYLIHELILCTLKILLVYAFSVQPTQPLSLSYGAQYVTFIALDFCDGTWAEMLAFEVYLPQVA